MKQSTGHRRFSETAAFKLLVFACLATLHWQASAQTMYKCVDQAGGTSYGTSPCRSGETQEWARESTPQQRRQPAGAGPAGSDGQGRANPPVTVTSGVRTSGNYPACRSDEWLSDLTAFVGSGDRDSFARYIEMDRCVVLREGLRATIIDGPGVFGSRVTFVVNGIKLWAPREALIYDFSVR